MIMVLWDSMGTLLGDNSGKARCHAMISIVDHAEIGGQKPSSRSICHTESSGLLGLT